MDELGYFPNTQARALVSGRSRIFGLVVSEFTNPFFPEVVQTFENLAVENNYEILLTSTVHDPKRMESAVRRIVGPKSCELGRKLPHAHAPAAAAKPAVEISAMAGAFTFWIFA